MGTAPILSIDEEAKIVQHLKSTASSGYGYTLQKVVDVATDYAVQVGKRTHDTPLTLDWFRRFVIRWPELHVLNPRALEQQRAKSASETTVLATSMSLKTLSTNTISMINHTSYLMLTKKVSHKITVLHMW